MDSLMAHRFRSAKKKLEQKTAALKSALASGNLARAKEIGADILAYGEGTIRDELNRAQPGTVNDALRQGFQEAGPGQAVFHGGEDAIKLVNPDGREVVFDRKTGKKITDERRGTYNYAHAEPADVKSMNYAEKALLLLNEFDHIALDIAPYKIQEWLAD